MATRVKRYDAAAFATPAYAETVQQPHSVAIRDHLAGDLFATLQRIQDHLDQLRSLRGHGEETGLTSADLDIAIRSMEAAELLVGLTRTKVEDAR